MTDGRTPSLFRAALRRGTALGTWVKIAAPESMELIALAGFDFAVIDMEHSTIDLETAYVLIGIARSAGVSPIVRVSAVAAGTIGRLLDAGAEGIMVPHVDTVEQAREAVAAVRFPPLGGRGVGATGRAGQWGALPRAEYVRFGQEEVVLIAQLESAEAIENTAAIAATAGVDVLLIGAADLAMSEGTVESDPRIGELIARSVADARVTGVPIGNAGGATSAAVQSAVAAGFAFTVMSNDASLLGTAARAAVQDGRKVTET